MELGKQIKKYRNELSLSQDVLAEKIYVSRQTISNWENDKSYPDVNSLLLLSEVFQVSIDNLIKGDIEEMKEQIKAEDKKEFEKLSNVFAILMLAMVLTPIPLVKFFNEIGMLMWGVLAVVTLLFSLKVEKLKKRYDIQTYKEIIAFTEGKSLTSLEKAKEEGKRPYQKILLVILSGIITFAVAVFMAWILK